MKLLKNVFSFYVDGFRNMKIGKTLWLIIGIKLLVMFAIIRVFFYPEAATNYLTDQQKADYFYKQYSR
jgi:hypothetical protein